MGFDVAEYAKKRKQEQESSEKSETSTYKGFDVTEYSKARSAEEIGKQIVERTNTWLNNNGVYINNFNNRYSGGNETYRTDSDDWLSTITTQNGNFKAEADSIKSLLELYGDYFTDEFKKSITDALDGNLETQGKIIETSTQDRDFWASFADEKTYNDWYAIQKDKDEKTNRYNLESGSKEIESWEGILNNAHSYETDILDRKSYLATGSSNSGVENYQGVILDEYKSFIGDLYGKYQRGEIDEETYKKFSKHNYYRYGLQDYNNKYVIQNELEDYVRWTIDGKERGLVDLLSPTGYGTVYALEQGLMEKKAYHKDAERLQFMDYTSWWATTSDDFAMTISGVGSAEQKTLAGKVLLAKQNATEKGEASAYDYGNTEKKAESKAAWDEYNALLAEYESTYGSIDDEHYLRYMKEDELKVYAYYIKQEDTETAKAYLNYLKDELRQREGGEIYEQWNDNIISQYVFAAAAGIEQWGTGVANFLGGIFGANPDPTTPVQYASQMIREDLGDVDLKWYNFKTGEWNDQKIFGSSLGQVGYDAANTIGNQLPSILVGAVTAGVGGAVTMGVSAAGNGYAEMINLGYSKDQAMAYGTMVGLAETGLSYILGGISSLGGKVSGGLTEAIANSVDNAIARVAIKVGGSMLSEGIEESLQEILDPWFKTLATGKIDWESPTIDEVLYSGLLGALSAGLLEGKSTVKSDRLTTKTGKIVQNIGAVERLTKLGSTFSADSVAYQLAGKVNENTGAYTIGRLLNEVGATLTSQNISDITTALESKGMSSKDAGTIAKWLEKAVEGEYFTDKQAAILENNEVVSEVFRDVIIDQNSTVNQRMMGYSEMMSLVKNGGTNTTADVDTVSAEESSSESTKVPQPADSSTETKTPTTAEISSQSSDKTTYNGNEVTVKEISSIKDGEVIVRLNSGEEVSTKDLDLSSRDYLIYEAVADMSVDSANEMIKGYNAANNSPNMQNHISAEAYYNGFREAYRYGTYGYPASEMSKNGFSASLSEEQRKIAYNRGRIDSASAVDAKQSRIDKTKGNVAVAKDATTPKKEKVEHKNYKGESHVSELSTKGLTERQKVSVKALKTIADTFGIDIYLFESPVVDGKRVGKNGYYNPKDRSIHLDLFAGRNGEQVILFTAAHELTHLIRDISPAKFKTFADFLFEHYGKKGVSVEQLVQNQINKAKANGRNIDYDTAYEEVVADACETMLTDSNAIEKIAELKAKDKTLWGKIKDFITKLVAKIKQVYAGLQPNSEEARYVREMVDVAEHLQALWIDALVDAGETYSTIGPRNLSEFSDAKTTSGESLFQYRAMEADKDAYRTMLLKHGLMTETEINNLFTTIDKAMDVIKNNLEALDYAWDVDIDDRAFMPVKPNSDKLYAVSLDFSTLCRKRLLQQTIQATLQEALNKPLSKEEGIAIRDELMKIQEEGRKIEIACALCYVESARMKSPTQIKKFLNNRVSVLIDFFAGRAGGSTKEKIKTAEADARAKLHRENPNGVSGKNGTIVDPLTSSLSKMATQYAEQIRQAKKAAKLAYKPTATEQKMIDAAKGMKTSDFTSPEGLENLAKNYPDIFDAYTSFVRNATHSKGIEKDTWWRAGDSDSLIGQSLIDRMNAENGLRSQSWSDFQVIHLLDYIAATIELSTKNAKRQSYTKVPDYVRLLGNTGDMINMSLIPMAKYNGKLGYDSVEGIDYKTALELREKYHATAGTICIGIDNNQIKQLLADMTIDYVIPYHKSSMSQATKKLMHIPSWFDYEPYQGESKLSDANAKANAKKYGVELLGKSDKKYNKHPDFSEWFDIAEARQIAEMENANPSDPAMQKEYGVMYGAYKAMQNAANNYLKLCAERGLAPKFSHSKADFTSEANYWKLLIDRKMVDNVTGEIIEQQAIKPVFDEADVLGILNDELQRYPQVKKDQEYATRKVVEKFLSGEMKIDKDTREAIHKTVDNVTAVNIVASSEDMKLSDRDTTSWRDVDKIQGLEDYSVSEVTNIVRQHIETIAMDFGEEISIIDIRPYGSRARGTAKKTSDLDVVVEYDGDIREDDMFNMLNDEDKLVIDGIEVDINPIKADDTGTIEEYLDRVYSYDKYNETKYSDRDSTKDVQDFVSLLKDTIKKTGGWTRKNVFEYMEKHPELDFIERIFKGDKQVTADLGEFLIGIDDVQLLHDFEWFLKGAYNGLDKWILQAAYPNKQGWQSSKSETPYRGAATTFHNAVKKRINAIMTAKVQGTNLGLDNGEVSLQDIKGLFDRLNSNNEMAELAEKVFATSEKLGVNIRFVNKLFSSMPKASGDNVGDMVEYKTSYFNNTAYADQWKAQVLLHELIHACTVYILQANTTDYNIPYLNKPDSYKQLARAAEGLKKIYQDVYSSYPELHKMYGLKNVNEFVAELSNLKFVGELKKRNIWDRIVDWLCNLFGINRGTTKVSTTAYDNARMCLDYILDNPEIADYKAYAREQRDAAWRSGMDTFGETKYSDRDNVSFSELDKWFDSLSLEEFNELISGDVSIDDISEELNVEPKKIEILIRRKGLGESHIEENRTAVMKQTRIDEAIEDSGAKFNPDYARKYITRISTKDFIDLTVSQEHVDRGQFDANVKGDHGNTMSNFDYEKALQDSQSPYLHIDQSTGRVIAHNGRHRIRALEKAGIESVEIEVQFFDEEGYLIKYNANTIPDMAISSQFDTAIETHLSTIIPLNEAHRAEIERTYGEKAHADAGVMYSDRVTDKETLNFLENQEHVTVYRAMQLIDGKLYPPMNAYTYDKNGKKVLVTPSEIGAWEQAVERPDLIDPKTGKFKLDKGKVDGGKRGTVVPAAYNPYIHTSLSMLNDQFTSAYTRSNLVVVKGVVPKSELTSGYHAQYAKDSVGETEWHSGVVSTQLPESRKVILSRWFKPVEVMDNNVVAKNIKKMLGNTGIEIPYNVVSPKLRRSLENIGVPIGEGRGIRNLPSKNEVQFQDRDTDSFSNRYLLANALETTAQNDIEKNKLAEYKKKIDLINSEEQHLHELRGKIKELSFAKGRRDTAQIRKLQAEATQTANRINTYDRQLLTLEASKPLKDVLEREKKLAYKKAEQKGKDALAAYRERTAETTRKLMEKYQESRKKGIENRNKTELRHKIKSVVSELNNLLLHGTKERNVKLGLQEAVASALDVINMDTVDAEGRIAKLQEELLKAKTPEKIQEISRKIDNIQMQGDRLGDKLKALKEAYSEIQHSENSGNLPVYFKEEAALIEQRIQSVIKEVGNTPLRNMSLNQLNAVYDMYKMVLTTIRNANGVWKEGKLLDLQENASAVMQEIENLPKLKEVRAKFDNAIRSYSWNEMTPYYAFDRIGSKTLMSFFWETIKGQNTYANDVYEARTFADEARKKYGYKKWNLDKLYEFKLKDGRTFQVTLKHLLSIYAYSKRDQALKHMSEGGFFFNDKSTFRKKGGVLELIKSTDEGYKIDEEMLEVIKSSLTSDQINYVDEMQNYLTKMGEKGNEVTRVLWGIDIFKEKVYFPLKSKEDFIKRSTETAQSVSLKNDGMTKETVPNASNPIVLEAFDDVWASHIDRMSQYHAFVIPIDNLNKIHQYGTWAGTASMSVSTMLTGRFGNAVNEYISQFIKDLNGSVVTQGVTNPLIGFFSKFKKTAVGASLSTVVQQPTAILRAMALVDTKYFVGKPNLKTLSKQWAELKKYAPIAIIKEIGGFDAGSGVQVSTWLNEEALRGKDKVMNTIDNISMKGAEVADQMGWTTIWEAIKRETKANNPNLQVGSEAFLEKAGERFTEVIVQTQVYDSTLSRSGFMRSKHDTVKMLTAFMGEPTLSINMMFNAIVKAVRGGKGAKAQAVRTIAYVYASMIAASAMASLIYALRDDDEDESYLEKYMQAFGGEVISDIVLAPITSLPVIKDIVSIFQGWDVERGDMSIIQDLYDASIGLFSDNKSTYRKIEDFAGAIAGFFGVPLKNVLRTGREIYNAFSAIFDGIEGGNLGDAFVEGITGEEASKSEKLYEAIINGDNARVEKYKEGYKDEDAYGNALRTALRENDSRIHEAAQARIDRDISEYKRIAKEIIAEGNFDQDTVVGAINAEISFINRNAEEEVKVDNDNSTEPEEEVTSIYKASDINAAFEGGDTAMAKEIIAELIDIKVANGMEEKDAKSSLRSSMTAYWKPLYKQAYKNKDTEEMKRIREILRDSGLYGRPSEILDTVKYWLKED